MAYGKTPPAHNVTERIDRLEIALNTYVAICRENGATKHATHVMEVYNAAKALPRRGEGTYQAYQRLHNLLGRGPAGNVARNATRLMMAIAEER